MKPKIKGEYVHFIWDKPKKPDPNGFNAYEIIATNIRLGNYDYMSATSLPINSYIYDLIYLKDINDKWHKTDSKNGVCRFTSPKKIIWIKDKNELAEKYFYVIITDSNYEYRF